MALDVTGIRRNIVRLEGTAKRAYDQPPANERPAHLAEIFGVSRPTVYRTLERLRADGTTSARVSESLLFLRGKLPGGLFRKLDAVAVLTGPSLPAPVHQGSPPRDRPAVVLLPAYAGRSLPAVRHHLIGWVFAAHAGTIRSGRTPPGPPTR